TSGPPCGVEGRGEGVRALCVNAQIMCTKADSVWISENSLGHLCRPHAGGARFPCEWGKTAVPPFLKGLSHGFEILCTMGNAGITWLRCLLPGLRSGQH